VPDLAVPAYYSNTVSVLLGSGGSLPTTAAPVFTPAGGTYLAAVVVTLTDSTPGATIYYTTDGSAPTTSSTVYAGPLALTQTTTLRAIAAASGMSNSGEASATYTIQNPVATPVLSPGGGTYVASVTVTINDTTAGATIYCTTDGSQPTTASIRYAGPFALTQTKTIRALAVASGMTDSAVATATYTIKAATPVATPASGTYISAVTVTIAGSTPGSVLHYTTDGTTPTTSSTAYAGPFALTQSGTVRAIAAVSGMANSDPASAVYTIQAATPTLSLAGGTYNNTQTVTLADATPGAAIYYTTDGSVPTPASTRYTAAIAVTQTTTVRAMAAAAGMVNSGVAAATYTLQAATPVFDPPSRSFVLPLSVSISSASPGVTIYYTTDGSTPTTSSNQYTGPISVVFTTTIKAIAVRTGWTSSPVATATYSLLGM
jgi:chitobiase/beta-hexosaminidase-like protein